MVASTTLPNIVRDVPRRFISGSRVLTAAFMASPAITSSGRKALPQRELTADLVDPDYETLVDRFERVDALLDRLPGQLFGDFSIAIDDALRHGFEQFCSHIDLLSLVKID